MTRTELLSLAEQCPPEAAAILRELAELRPVAWQERTQLSAHDWTEWYERQPMPMQSPRSIESGGVMYEFRPLYQLSEVLTDA